MPFFGWPQAGAESSYQHHYRIRPYRPGCLALSLRMFLLSFPRGFGNLHVAMATPSSFWLRLTLIQFAYIAFAALNQYYYPNQEEVEYDFPCNPDSDSTNSLLVYIHVHARELP